jgi:hypothetical protein
MNAKPRSRLERLEQSRNGERDGLAEEIHDAAVRAMSDEDLGDLESYLGRDGSLPKATPAEKAALARYATQNDAAALNLTGRTCRELGLFQILG